jgi:hypothetical protein
MTDLDSRARALIDAAREGDQPSRADRDRIKHTVLLRAAAVGATASIAGAATAGTLSVAAKVGAVVLVATLAGGGTVGVIRLREARHAASPSRQQTAHARTVIAPKVERMMPEAPAEAVPEMVVPARPESKVHRAEKPRKLAEPAPPESNAEDHINAEVTVLKRAREALRVGHPAQALRALAEYDRLFGRGALGEERQAMAAIALCQVKPGPASSTQAEAFIRSAPASPLVERVRAACIAPRTADSP